MKTSKRILCLLLVLIMTLSVGTVALADTVPASQFSFDDGNSATVYIGTPKKLAYTVQPSDFNGTITWSSSATGVATVAEDGTVTAIKTGTTTITAKVPGVGGDITATCTVTVAEDAVKEFIFTDSGTDDTYRLSVGEGSSTQVHTKATFLSGKTDTGTSNVSFYTEDPDIAAVTSTGAITAKAAGSTFLHADYLLNGKIVKTTSAEIVVSSSSISVSIDQKEGLTGTSLEVGVNESVKFTATVKPSSLQSRLRWDIGATAESTATINAKTGAFAAKSAASSITVKAYIDLNDNEEYDSGEPNDTISVSIITKPLTSVSLSNATLSIGGTKTLTPVLSPASASLDSYDLVWSAACTPTNCITIDSETGKITAKASGTANVMLQLFDKGTKNVAFVATCVVTVQNATYDYATTAKVGTNSTLSTAASSLSTNFKSKSGSGAAPSSAATFTVDAITGTSYGTLYTSSSKSTTVAVGSTRLFSTVSSLYFVPKAAGSFTISYTIQDGSFQMTGTITIKVSSTAKNITIEIDNSDEDYIFTSDKNSDETPAYEIITDALGSTLSYIEFGDIDPWQDDDVGTLYSSSASSAKSVESDGKSYLNKTTGTYTIRKLCFSPNGDEGTFAIEYTAYNSSDVVIATGYLFIVVGEGSGDVVVHLDDDEPYYFSDKTAEDKYSAYSMICDFIEEETSLDAEDAYIKFTDFIDDDAGTLYYDDDEDDEVDTKTRYDMDEVYDFYFVPEEAGTYEVEFNVYSSATSTSVKATGVLQIVVPGASAAGDLDIYYNVTVSNTISFTESVFLQWYREQTSSSYKLAYVTFDDIDYDAGTFKCGTSTFDIGDGDKFYSSTYTGTKPTGYFSLGSVKYTAPKTANYIAVDFTCYGGTTATSTSTKKSGTMYIYITKGSVKDISISVKAGTTVDLTETAFLNAYKSATSTTSSSTEFYIQLLEAPSKGKLYLNYTSASKPGTQITASNISKYDLYVNGGASDDSVADLTYVPATGATGVVTVHYLAYDEDGEPLYVGTLSFNYGTAKTMSCYSNGYTFKASDFYTITDSDPVMSVTFKTPTSGKLYVNYANGVGTAVSSSTKFYTATSAYGNYNITSLTFIPKAGTSGNVTLEYTATTAYGSTYDGTITMNVMTKTASTTFSDVTTATVGSWAADSIDFASSWGLVKGTTTTAPYKYAPQSNMKRCDLLLILYRIAGSPAVTGTVSYTDVSSSAYYYNAVVWATKNGITSGAITSTSTFAPNTIVTRQEFATFLYNFTKYRGVSTTNSGSLTSYTDVSKVSSYAKDAMTWAVAKGYITSTSTTSLILDPTGTATRAQIAVLLHRYLTY